MESRLFGFLLDKSIQLDIDNKMLVRYEAGASECSMCFKYVTLNDIQLRILVMLLDNELGVIITKDDIIKNIWSEEEVYPSDKRLWYLIKMLRKKLYAIGISKSFISNAHGVGYFLDGHEVSPIFFC